MMENLITMELARQLTWSEERGQLYHYRTKDKLEVDAVIENTRRQSDRGRGEIRRDGTHGRPRRVAELGKSPR